MSFNGVARILNVKIVQADESSKRVSEKLGSYPLLSETMRLMDEGWC